MTHLKLEVKFGTHHTGFGRRHYDGVRGKRGGNNVISLSSDGDPVRFKEG